MLNLFKAKCLAFWLPLSHLLPYSVRKKRVSGLERRELQHMEGWQTLKEGVGEETGTAGGGLDQVSARWGPGITPLQAA